MAMFFGVGILKVKGLYRKLRKLATRYGGVIVFFDEADSLGNRGGAAQGGWNIDPTPGSAWSTAPSCNGLGYVSEPGRRNVLFGAVPEASGPRTERMVMPGYGGGGMGTLQALLSEMDGLKKPRGFVNRVIRRALGMKPKPPPKYRILHIFATNQPGVLDEAMLRPGRIDRIYKVGYPHLDGRTATFVYYLAKVKHELTDEQMLKLATITPYASGALIKDTVNEALVIAIRDGRETITWRDIVMAKQLKEHGLPDDHEYIKRERHAVAVHEACHAVVAYRLRKHAVIDVATIERRGDVGGFVSSIPPEDQFVEWRSERDIDIMTFLASLAGERLFFDGDHSTGVGGDMRGATTIATQMLAYYAMGDTIAARSVTLGGMRGGQPDGDRVGSSALRHRVRQAGRREVDAALRRDLRAARGQPDRGPRGRARVGDAQDDHWGRRRSHRRRSHRIARRRPLLPGPGLPSRAGALSRCGREGAPGALGGRHLDADADAAAPPRRAPTRAERAWNRAGARGYVRSTADRAATGRRHTGDAALRLGILAACVSTTR